MKSPVQLSNLGYWTSSLSLYFTRCLSMASINKQYLICSVAVILPFILRTEVCSCALRVRLFVDKVSIQTCYFFTHGFQVAWLFIFVGFWENERSHWMWRFRSFGCDTWHHTLKSLNLLQHCCENSNLSH
jgi:hypothetical protein